MVVVAAQPPITEDDLAALVATMDEAAAAYIDGDIEHYLSLFDHGDDYTLIDQIPFDRFADLARSF
jgi:hypothetical protein